MTIMWVSGPGVRPDRRRHPRARPLGEAQVILMPAMAVDTRGRWLGRGSGLDDEVARRLGSATFMAVAVHDAELFDAAVESVPFEPDAQRVHLAVTPSRALLLRPQ